MSFPRYPAYKDSGVEWLGEVPEHWRVLRLSQIGRLEKGNGGNKQDETDTGVPCVRYGDLYTVHRHFIRHTRSFLTAERAVDYTPVQFGDVLFAASGETMEEIGKSAVNLIPGDVRCGGDVILLRPVEKIDPVFSGYALDNPFAAAQKARMGRGFTVVHIYGTQLRNLAVPLPPLPEQTAISTFLDRETAKIDALVADYRTLIELLQEKRQAVISHAVTKGLDPTVPMKDSGVEWLGEVPEHWLVGKCGFYLSILSGFAFPSAGFSDDEADTRLLRGVNVAVGRLRWNDVVYWRHYPGDGLDSYEMRDGDLVVGMDRPLISEGIRVAKVTSSDLPCLLLQRVACLKPTGQLCSDYLFALLSSEMFVAHFSPETTGVSVPHISPEQIGDFVVPIPPMPEQLDIIAEITHEIVNLDDLIADAQQAITLLQERRTALISAAVTGKIDVRGLVAIPEN